MLWLPFAVGACDGFVMKIKWILKETLQERRMLIYPNLFYYLPVQITAIAAAGGDPLALSQSFENIWDLETKIDPHRMEGNW